MILRGLLCSDFLTSYFNKPLAEMLRAFLYGCSSVGRASVSKTECRGFESLHLCHLYLGIAQPGSALVLGTRGRWFESSYRDHFADVLLGEDSAFQADGVGSNPVIRSKVCSFIG